MTDAQFSRAYAKAIERLDAAIEALLIERTKLAVELAACLQRKARELEEAA